MQGIKVQVAVEYLRARAQAEAGTSECSPDTLMLSQAADLLLSLLEEVRRLKERSVVLQRQLSEYECREMQG